MSGQTQIIIPDTPKKTDSRYAKNKKHKLFRKRAGIEPVIGHCKADHRLGRNFYKGLFGDSINVMLAAAAFNFKRAMRLLLCLIERVIMWCCGRQELNFQHQFFPQGLFEKCDVAFLRVDYLSAAIARKRAMKWNVLHLRPRVESITDNNLSIIEKILQKEWSLRFNL